LIPIMGAVAPNIGLVIVVFCSASISFFQGGGLKMSQKR
jgi:hypothetical protein